MKDWSADHPKAKLMSRKRDMIVRAASEAFLRDGYSGASMERIAASAGVSIMTLYRHAKTKDDLFAAVIAKACHPADHIELAQIEAVLQQPLRDVLVFVGVMFQERVTSEATAALLRTVVVETARFPHIARLAYQGLIGSHQDALGMFLNGRHEMAGLESAEQHRLAANFLDRLIGVDVFRILLGLPGLSDAERRDRAEDAAGEFMTMIRQRSPNDRARS